MSILWQDARYAWRMLRASRGFSVVAVLTLALGIGGNTAIVTLISAVFLSLRPGLVLGFCGVRQPDLRHGARRRAAILRPWLD
ncbi:MAG: hypothetical protein R2752_15570 [Vicinamibacterales bacterium]